MIKFYRLLDDVRIPGRWHLDDPMTDEGCDPWDFKKGQPIRPISKPIVEVQIPGVALDFTLTNLAVPIGSPRLLSAIQNLCTENVQRIPVQLGAWEGYEILNAIRLVQCIDEKQSEFIKWTEKDGRPDRLGDYKAVSRLRIDSSLVPGDVNWFRIIGWNIALIVSQAVVDAFRGINATGAVFHPVFD